MDYESTDQASNSLLDPNSFYKASPEKEASNNRNIFKVLYMSISFFVLFTANSGAITLVTEIYEQLGYNSLGKINLLLLYGTFSCAAFLAPGLIKNWSYKRAIFIGSLGYIFTVGAGCLTISCHTNPTHIWCTSTSYVYISNIGGSILNGLTAPILWLASSKYIIGCANKSNEGLYLGIFNSFVFASAVMGSFLAAVVIKLVGQLGLYILACGLAVTAILMFLLAPDVPKATEEDNEESIAVKARKMVKLTWSPRMRPFLLYLFLNGVLNAIYGGFEYSVMLSAIPNDTAAEQDVVSADIFIVEGVMTIIAGFLAGKMADSFRRRPVLNIFTYFGILAIILSALGSYTGNIIIVYGMASAWGIAYAGGYTLLFVVMAKDFDGSLEAYGIVQFMPNLACALGYGLTILVTNIPIFLIISSVIVLATLVSTFMYNQKEDKEDKIEAIY